jgi:integrase/recombinase XerD
VYLICTKLAVRCAHAARDLPSPRRRLQTLRQAAPRFPQPEMHVPTWVQGSLAGDYLRRSLDLVSWEAAQDLVRGWEASGEVGVVKAVVPSIDEAIERFFDDVKARGLSEATIGKQNVLLRKQFLPWCHTRGFRSLKQLGVDELTQFRATWADSPISKYKKQERLKGFLHFCVARERIRTNPVAAIKPVKVPPSQTLPFEEEQVTAILDACDRYPTLGIYGERNRTRLKALTLLMRYSGLRIGDAVTCERERLVKSKLFLYQAKTGTPVYCPLPPVVIDALNQVEGPNPKYFFWTGNGKVKSAVADAQRSFRKLFELAEVEGHPHMFRDTFAVELLKHGVALETVSMLLGHASIKRTHPHGHGRSQHPLLCKTRFRSKILQTIFGLTYVRSLLRATLT